MPCRVYLVALLVTISFSTVTPLYAEDTLEPNDSLNGAAPLSFDAHNLELAANNEDWFKFENLDPGLLYLSLEHPFVPDGQPAPNELHMVLYNSDGAFFGASQLPNTKDEINAHIIIPGTYYVNIYAHFPNGTNTYTLVASRSTNLSGDDSKEDNDSFSASKPIADYNSPILNQINKDDDWFSFPAPAGTFTVSVTYDDSTILGLEAYNSSGGRLALSPSNPALIGTSGNLSPATIEVDIDDADIISLVVFGGKGANYSLTIDHPVVWSTVLSTGANSAASPTIFDIDGDGKGEILIGSRPHLDGSSGEQKPAGLVYLEDDGTVKWTQTFEAASITDPITGLTYNTSSIATRPAVADIDGDGDLEIVIGVGVDLDNPIPPDSFTYSPGHKGGVYALNALTGDVEWSRISLDTIGGDLNVGDGLSDGVISSPIVCDLDQDGIAEVIWGGWDQRIYVVDGQTGLDFGSKPTSLWPVNVLDTNWSTPLCADINNDGLHEILIGGDITENPAALTETGGIFHVFDRWGRDIIDGFRTPIEFIPDSGNFSFIKGKYEEQTIWSSPIAADLDGDGTLEIAYGTGLFKAAPFGEYIHIWNHDGTEYLKLATMGAPFSVPLFADLDNDGDLEIVITTNNGWVHAWDHSGNLLFATQTFPSGGTGGDFPIYSSPLAVDLDGDSDLEIIYQQANTPVIVDSFTGLQLTDPTKWGLNNESFRGTPAIGDLNGDGNLEIITGGTNAAGDTGIVYAFKFGTVGNAIATGGTYNFARRQFRESGVVPISTVQVKRRTQVSAFVTRFYKEVLGHATPDAKGLAGWINGLLEGSLSAGDVGRGFILSPEFVNQAKSKSKFLDIMYKAFFDRAADSGGKDAWLAQIDGGASRSDVLNGFIGAQEFLALSNSFNISPEFTATQGLRRKFVEEFVTLFYNQILLRAPDAGLIGWVDGTMKGELSGANLANGFINSTEFLQRGLDNTEYVKVLYRAFFGRSSTAGERAGWVNGLDLDPLDKNALTRQQVLDGFIGAPEFIKLAARFGIRAS